MHVPLYARLDHRDQCEKLHLWFTLHLIILAPNVILNVNLRFRMY